MSLQILLKASINTLRVKLGGIANARKMLADGGYVTEDGTHYTRTVDLTDRDDNNNDSDPEATTTDTSQLELFVIDNVVEVVKAAKAVKVKSTPAVLTSEIDPLEDDEDDWSDLPLEEDTWTEENDDDTSFDDYPDCCEDVASNIADENRATIVTSYLLGSHVDKPVWKALMAHAVEEDAHIVVIAHRYSNPTNIQKSLREEEGASYIDPLVKPYLCWEDHTVNNHTIAASVRINPTTINPLASAKRFCTGHTIIGHSIQTMTVKPTTVRQMPNVLWTTGTVSQIEPSDNLKAKVAQFHYKFGWILVNTDGSSTNIHTTKDGKFTDLNKDWNGESWQEPYYKAVVWGDYHHGTTSPEAKNWAIGITRQLRPDLLVLHDFIDASTVNPHASNYERSLHFDGSLEKELFSCSKELVSLYRSCNASEIGLVVSNHNDMVSRYLNGSKVSDLSRGDQLVLARWLLAGKSPERLVKSWVQEIAEVPLRLLNEATEPDVITLGLHGDVGANGSKGSIAQYFNQSIKCVVGHGHSANILGGANQVGTLTHLRVGYNDRGLSNWINSIATINAYDKVQHHIMFY